MKKRYSKPKFIYDSFTMAQSIAVTCAGAAGSTVGHPTFGDPNGCTWIVGDDEDPDDIFFSTQNRACNEPVEDHLDIGGGCYNGPTGQVQIFGS